MNQEISFKVGQFMPYEKELFSKKLLEISKGPDARMHWEDLGDDYELFRLREAGHKVTGFKSAQGRAGYKLIVWSGPGGEIDRISLSINGVFVYATNGIDSALAHVALLELVDFIASGEDSVQNIVMHVIYS